MTPRATIALLVALAATGCHPAAHHAPEPANVSQSPGDGPSRWVDPFVGTADAKVGSAVLNGKSGATFPGAALPFGMVQLSPDTPNAAPAGYAYEDDRIVGFSLTHLNGAGCLAMRDFPIMPLIGDFVASVEPSAGFSHASEIASPGFYEVTLDSGVKVDLTATTRSGFLRFAFPDGADAKIALAGSFSRDRFEVLDFAAQVAGPDLVTGHRDDGLFCTKNTRYTVYFAARFERPFASHGSWSEGDATPGADAVTGRESGLYFGFDTADDRVVQMKVGLSYVSAAAALANLDAENPGWDFEAVHRAALAANDRLLGRVAVEGGSDDDRRLFYTALYHALLEPSVTSDANGDFLEFGGAKDNAGAHRRYGQISGWDAYRSWVQLAAMVAPDETSDVARSLVAAGQHCGALPRWPIQNQESSTMIGDPAPLILANAYAFGARGFDAKQGLTLALHSAYDPSAACGGKVVRDDLADYLARGYCPIDAKSVAWGPVSTTLEYAVADFGVGQLAQALASPDDAATLLARARNWQKVFDPARKANGFTGYVQPRHAADQQGAPSFDAPDIASDTGFVEGNAAQYTFMVPHDVAGLAVALGGDAATVTRLDAFVAELNAGTDRPFLYIGNEPSFGIPWLYPFVGAPARTQAVVRRVLREVYALAPGGLPGNDDLGATSSWQVWAMLGMYPAIPGVGGVVLGSPTFPKTTVTLAGGKKLVITAAAAAPDKPYVKSLRVNGAASTSTWIPWSTLAAGATLDFELVSAATTWGTGAADRPPSSYPP